MSGQLWDSGKVDIKAIYPFVPYREKYEFIQDFLTDEQLVRKYLLLMDQRTSSKTDFYALLTEHEHRYGFYPQVASILQRQGGIPSDMFLGYVRTRRPIMDYGAGHGHGWLTHRVQWVMIGLWNDEFKRLGDPHVIADLYSLLASPGARRPQNSADAPFRDLWDDLVDGLARNNATQPEFLHWEYVKANFGGLFAKWD
jgi:hypothetical protein